MYELLIVKHCSPTLAGIKTASLFNYSFDCKIQLNYNLERFNSILNPRGVYVKILREETNRALIYVYRPSKLKSDFSNESVRKILSKYGYTDFDLDSCIERLSKRLLESEKFPHEIGLFLGYPPSDVKGFIENKGKNYKFVGHWKVYNDEFKAKKIFENYNKCKNIYCEKLLEGTCIKKLTVAF